MQAGDTTMDEAVSLLREAMELLDRDNRPEVESWRDRVIKFINPF